MLKRALQIVVALIFVGAVVSLMTTGFSRSTSHFASAMALAAIIYNGLFVRHWWLRPPAPPRKRRPLS